MKKAQLISVLLMLLAIMPAFTANAAKPGAGCGYFTCNALGYVRHWLVIGPEQAPYTAKAGNENFMRQAGVQKTIIEPASQAAPGAKGPLGKPWTFYYPGANNFVECTAFYHQLRTLDYYAFTEIEAPRAMRLPARLWAVGQADLWVNGEHMMRSFVLRNPEAKRLEIELKPGRNQFFVRLQCVGIRDTNMLFGLQFMEGAQELKVRIPGPAAKVAALVEGVNWLDSVKARGKDALAAAGGAPKAVRVAPMSGKARLESNPWPTGKTQMAIDPATSFQVSVMLRVNGQLLERLLEIPANQKPAEAPGKTLEEHRRQRVERIAGSEDGRPVKDVMQILARRMLGRPRTAEETAQIEETLKGIEGRKDCSDFTLAALLRMIQLGFTSPEETAKIKTVALGFRYWNDEPGNDAMCFGSENHSLLFHGCQMIAGRMWPDETFSNTGRKGAEQAELGKKRVLGWLDRTEKNGFVEFLSSTYMPLTTGALMNVVDFSGDAEISKRAAALADRIFENLALQAFDGVTVGPQGRVYRNVLYPQASGTQAMLSYATPAALVSSNGWLVFVASSKTYQPPQGLEKIMREPALKTYRQDNVEITVNKTPAWLLTSLQIPASFAGTGKGGKPVGLMPGAAGYQQHLWHATLGRGCHVFVNHPGASFDQSESRPGYWYGNGVLPRLAQRGGMLMEIFDIPEKHHIPYTHAHWPSDAFDRQEAGEHWAFGMKGDGYIALWCSAKLTKRDEVLTGRELLALGQKAAWLCVCGEKQKDGDFESFKKACMALGPAFDEQKMKLTVKGVEAMSWK